MFGAAALVNGLGSVSDTFVSDTWGCARRRSPAPTDRAEGNAFPRKIRRRRGHLASASSSGRRGSPPCRMSSTAIESRYDQVHDDRSAELVCLLAQRSRGLARHRPASRARSPVAGRESGGGDARAGRARAAEILTCSEELFEEDEGAGGVPVDDEVAQTEPHLVLDPRRGDGARLEGDRAGRCGTELSSVDPASRNEPRANGRRGRATVGQIELLALGDPAQVATMSGSRGRWKSKDGSVTARSAAPSSARSCRRTNIRCGADPRST